MPSASQWCSLAAQDTLASLAALYPFYNHQVNKLAKKQDDAMPFVVLIFLLALALPILGSIFLPIMCYYIITRKIIYPYNINFPKKDKNGKEKTYLDSDLDEYKIFGETKFDINDIILSDSYLMSTKESIIKMKHIIKDIENLRENQKNVKVRKDGLWEERSIKSKEANVLLEKYREDARMLMLMAGISLPDYTQVVETLSERDSYRYNYISFVLFTPTVPVTFMIVEGALLKFLKTVDFYSFINKYNFIGDLIIFFDIGFSFIPPIVMAFILGPILKAISDNKYPFSIPKDLHYQCELRERNWASFRDCESVVDERDIAIIQESIEISSINFNRVLLEHLEIVKDQKGINDALNFLNKQVDNRDVYFEQSSKNILSLGLIITLVFYFLLGALGLEGLYNMFS